MVLAVVAEIARERIYMYKEGEVVISDANTKRRSSPKKVLLGYFDDYQSFKVLELYMKNYGKYKFRVLGSAALEIISVGLGNADVFIDLRNMLRNFDVAASLRIAIALGAKAYIPGYEDPLDMPIDRVVRVNCIVGFDDNSLAKVLEIMKQATFQDLASR